MEPVRAINPGPLKHPQTIPALAAPRRRPSARPVAKASWCALDFFYEGGDHSRESPFVVWGAKLDRSSACWFPRATVSSTVTWPYRAAKEVTRG